MPPQPSPAGLRSRERQWEPSRSPDIPGGFHVGSFGFCPVSSIPAEVAIELHDLVGRAGEANPAERSRDQLIALSDRAARAASAECVNLRSTYRILRRRRGRSSFGLTWKRSSPSRSFVSDANRRSIIERHLLAARPATRPCTIFPCPCTTAEHLLSPLDDDPIDRPAVTTSGRSPPLVSRQGSVLRRTREEGMAALAVEKRTTVEQPPPIPIGRPAARPSGERATGGGAVGARARRCIRSGRSAGDGQEDADRRRIVSSSGTRSRAGRRRALDHELP